MRVMIDQAVKLVGSKTILSYVIDLMTGRLRRAFSVLKSVLRRSLRPLLLQNMSNSPARIVTGSTQLEVRIYARKSTWPVN